MKGLEKINVNCKEIKEIDLRINSIFDISKSAKVTLQVKILYDHPDNHKSYSSSSYNYGFPNDLEYIDD